jgi:hypothetical protein
VLSSEMTGDGLDGHDGEAFDQAVPGLGAVPNPGQRIPRGARPCNCLSLGGQTAVRAICWHQAAPAFEGAFEDA